MNVEQLVRAALAEEVAAVEPAPGAWERVVRRSRTRRRLLVPLTAAGVALLLVAGVTVALRRDDGPSRRPLAPPEHVEDLYLPDGSVWPLQSRADAEAWRADRDSAPYLAAPDTAAREFLRTVLGLTGEITPEVTGTNAVKYFTGTNGVIGVIVARRPGTEGPWVVTTVTPNADNGWPTDWRRTRNRLVRSPVEIAVLAETDRYTVEIAELGDGGRYTVLGAVTTSERPRSTILYPSVAFREPSAGFGVILVRGYDAEGRLTRAYAHPTSFRDDWPFPEPRPPSSARPAPTAAPPPARFFAIRDGSVVVEVETAGGRIVRTLSEDRPGGVSDLHLDPSGSTLWFARSFGSCESVVANRSLSGGAEAVTAREDGHQLTEPAVSHDGTRLAFVRQRCGGDTADVVILDLRDRSRITIPAGRRGRGADHLSWSPDGTRLALDVRIDPDDAWLPAVLDLATGTVHSLDDARFPERDARCQLRTPLFGPASGLLAISELCFGEALRISLYDPATLRDLSTLFFAEMTAPEVHDVNLVVSYDIDRAGLNVVYVLGDGSRQDRPRIGTRVVPADVSDPVW